MSHNLMRIKIILLNSLFESWKKAKTAFDYTPDAFEWKQNIELSSIL